MDPDSNELQFLRSGSLHSSQRLIMDDAESHTSGRTISNGSSPPRYPRDPSFHAAKTTGHVTQSNPSTYSCLIGSSWVLEVLAWILAAITLIILIIVLTVFNGKPLSNWHSGVSVNTLVNVLTTIASIALIFPVASGIAQIRWLWLAKQASPVADIESFGAGPIDIFMMLWKHPTM